VLQPNETRRTAARAEPSRRAFRGDRNGAHLFADEWALARAHEPDRDEVTFDHFADGRQNRRNITAAHPLPAAWIKHGLQLIYDKGHVAAPAEDGANHARERDGPRVSIHVFGVDEHFERSPAAVLLDVVDRDVEGVIGVVPFDLVGLADQHLGAIEW